MLDFTLHAGTPVQIRRAEGAWREIQAPGHPRRILVDHGEGFLRTYDSRYGESHGPLPLQSEKVMYVGPPTGAVSQFVLDSILAALDELTGGPEARHDQGLAGLNLLVHHSYS